MYQNWVEEVSRTPCGKCHCIPTHADIIAVGAARPAAIEAYVAPLAMILVLCLGCGERMCIPFASRWNRWSRRCVNSST